MDNTVESSVDLGFIEKCSDLCRLNRCYFPSKLGGKPAWLDPKHIPSVEDFICQSCLKQMVFLLQIYAPDGNNDKAFHRTIYVFCCKTGSCYEHGDNQPIKVLRCNLPRKNDFYSYNPPDYDNLSSSEGRGNIASLCHVCGLAGTKTCSQCKVINYCGKEHQRIDWKFHKPFCVESDTELHKKPGKERTYLFSENEIIIEAEEDFQDEDKNVESNAKSKTAAASLFDENDLQEFAGMCKEDKQFLKFQRRISHEPEQIIRYDRRGKPLWCSDNFIPQASDIPPCLCGSERVYEFQIMPYLLSHLNVDTTVEDETIDWGTIAIYTCSKSCSPDVSNDKLSYIPEFAWKQTYS
ncbi:programmed cell death protein 2-like isoform X1 [Clavelina lepadiformis]|uniref:programmed cell death protein 2-like isoform X1 n=1 Tax=Clavelina lepadiformis TaxID=159417 RepID=UPI004041BBD9